MLGGSKQLDPPEDRDHASRVDLSRYLAANLFSTAIQQNQVTML
jgi:hypothetical protein